MLQIGTIFKVIDNTGAKSAICLQTKPGYRRKYAFLGDIVIVSIRSLRARRRVSTKVKKGEIYKAIVLRMRFPKSSFSGDSFYTIDNASIFLLNKQGKIFGTRIFGSVSRFFRVSKYFKVLSLSSGSVV
jgi:large subunit ribosomal protein L14